MRSNVFKYLAISAFSLLFPISIIAQNVYKVNESESNLEVTGTSTIHDWEMEVENFSCKTSLKTENLKVEEIDKIDLECAVSDLKSDNSIMDGKTYKALKKSKFPKISFYVDNTENVVSTADKTLTGKLTIAGKTREVKATYNFTVQSGKEFSVKGEVPIKMSDFGIDPPTAMLGTLKTGDEVVIKYDFTFNKTQEELTQNK